MIQEECERWIFEILDKRNTHTNLKQTLFDKRIFFNFTRKIKKTQIPYQNSKN
jgi:hypothetical protein